MTFNLELIYLYQVRRYTQENYRSISDSLCMALVSKIYHSLTCMPCFVQHLRRPKGAITIYITNIPKILIALFLQFQPLVCWYIYFMKQNSRQVSNTSTFFKNDCVSEYILCQMTQLYYLVMYVGQVQNKVFMTQFYAYHCILEYKINTNTHTHTFPGSWIYYFKTKINTYS